MRFSLRLSFSTLLMISFLSLVQGCSGAASTPAGADDSEYENDDNDTKKKTTLKDDKESTTTKKTEEKEKKPDTTVVRRQMTNISDKITRAQANLQRTESLRNNAVDRRNTTKSELAQVELQKNDQNSGGFGNPIKKTKAELQALIVQQTEEVNKFDSEVKSLEDEIAQYEAELDALTLKLEKK